MEHRFFTTVCHLFLFLAARFLAFRPRDVFVICHASSPTLCGAPSLPFPLGFHSNTALAMFPSSVLSVWPIHLQDRFFFSVSMGFCPVCCYKFSFLILSGYLMPRIRHKHLLACTWILFKNVAVCQQSRMNNTDLTFEEKIFSFIFNNGVAYLF